MKQKTSYLLSLILLVFFNSAEANTDFKKSTLHFIADLQKISEIPNFEKIVFANYKPWEKPYVIVNRNDPFEFVGINLECPAKWKCRNLSGYNFKVIEGRAKTAFSAPINMNFDMFVPTAADKNFYDKSIQEIFAVNQLKLLVSASFPFVLGQLGDLEFSKGLKDKTWLQSYTILHEGFHLYLQMASFYMLPTPWKIDFKQYQETKRKDAHLCFSPQFQENRDEEAALVNLWKTYWKSPDKISRDEIRHWIDLREKRLSAIPNTAKMVTNIRTSDCRVLDTLYEKVEGLADYVTFTYMLEARSISKEEVTSYMNGLYINAPAALKNLDYRFYLFGFSQALLLSSLNTTGEWKMKAVEEPNTSLTDLVKLYSNESVP